MEEQITLRKLQRSVGVITQSCWTGASTVYELQEKKNFDNDLVSLNDDIKLLRRANNALHDLLRAIGNWDREGRKYQATWDGIDGCISDCGRFMHIFQDILASIRATDMLPPQERSKREIVNRMDLEYSHDQMRSHHVNISICRNIVLVHVTADLAVQKKNRSNTLTDHLPRAIRSLAIATARLPSHPAYGTVEPINHYRLRDLAIMAQADAEEVLSASGSSLHTIVGDSPGRARLQEWLVNTGITFDEESEAFVEQSESVPPEVSLSPQRTLVNNSVDSGSTGPNGNQVWNDVEETDDLSMDLVRDLIQYGKEHYENENMVQAFDGLERALGHAIQLRAFDYSTLDLTETRSILATIALQNRQLDVAKGHLIDLVAESLYIQENRHFIAKAHHQLGQIDTARRNYTEAREHCKRAISIRERLYGKDSPEYSQSLQLCVLIFNGQNLIPEAELMFRKLPEEYKQVTRDMMQSNQTDTLDLLPPGHAANQIHPRTPTRMLVSNSHGRLPSIDRSGSYSAGVHSIDGSGSERGNQISLMSMSFRDHGSPSIRTGSTVQDVIAISDEGFVATMAKNGFVGDFDASKALSWAIMTSNEYIVHRLIEGYPIVRPKRRFSLGSDDTVTMKRIPVDGGPKVKVSPLVVAIIHDQVLIVKYLLSKGAKLSTRDDIGRTSLHIAAEFGQTDIIGLLLEAGASMQPGDKSIKQWSPWHVAAKYDHLDVLKLFLARGADINYQDTSGSTALKITAATGNGPSCVFLLDNGADVNICSDDGSTPLISSIRSGTQETTWNLLKNYANIDGFNRKGQTALNVAAYEGRDEEVRLMLIATPKPNLEIADDKGWTALMTAARYSRVVIVQRLIMAGANVNAHCHRNSTPLDHAIRSKNKAVERFIKDAGGHKGSGLTEPLVQAMDAFKGYGGF